MAIGAFRAEDTLPGDCDLGEPHRFVPLQDFLAGFSGRQRLIHHHRSGGDDSDRGGKRGRHHDCRANFRHVSIEPTPKN